ncbi:MAG: PqqD family protein [Planctomycetes bacterium]|nr:PqqD family protein [Planctomycetota bacterium]
MAYHTLDGEAIVVEPVRRQMSHLNEVAAFVWEHLRTPRTRDDLERALLETYEIDRPTALSDLNDLLKELEEKGLIRAEGPGNTC